MIRNRNRQHFAERQMPISLVLAVVLLLAWVVFGFLVPVASGAVHLLYAAGTTLLVRWWGETR
jgi:uncharacterized membrane protein YhdT